MRWLVITLLFTLSAAALPAKAQMYRWVDEKGNVHFSDKTPGNDAEQYEPPPIMVMPAGPGGELKPLKKPDTRQISYKTLVINTPANDAVFTPDKSDSVQVSLELTPKLNVRHNIALYLNGELHTLAQQLNFTLTGLPRGTHTVSASVIDKENKKLITSNSISFHIQRHHIR